MKSGKLVSSAVKLAALAVVVYGARHVDIHRLLASVESPDYDRVAPAAGPCVDINSASRADLQRIIHVDGDRSREIMEHRLVEPFRSLDDLDRISGMGDGWIQDIRNQHLACVR
ncbi:MAG TPA: helix-hairpin-helix domain-containing protein [Gemmatimonadota bacterium]|nr:helix-hairpin-helix domain-containing protein [Gemmatimonadota bacterium]